MKEHEILFMLKKLALKGAMFRYITVKTGDFGKECGMSQQSASRKLSMLEKMGFVERIPLKNGFRVKLSLKGIEKIMNDIKNNREIEKILMEIEIRGKVVGGSGEGSYYMTKKGYVEQIKELFNFIPYPGTLNIEIEGENIYKIEYLRYNSKYFLKEFYDEGRTFGKVYVHKGKIGEIYVYVIFPERSHYRNVIEIISDKCLRKELGLKDGMDVSLKIFPEI